MSRIFVNLTIKSGESTRRLVKIQTFVQLPASAASHNLTICRFFFLLLALRVVGVSETEAWILALSWLYCKTDKDMI